MSYTQSFNKNSKVTDISQDAELANENLLIDYDSSSYIRVMKLFTPENIGDINEIIRKIEEDDDEASGNQNTKKDKQGKSSIDFNEEYNKPFHLRCYLPKSIIKSNGSKISKVVIMLNGMNEVTNYDLYDYLGEHFTNNNMAAVFLPTPLHLNRRICKKPGKPYTPTDLADKCSILFYLNFIKSHSELCKLVKLIQGNVDIETTDNEKRLDYDFYKTYFWNEKNNGEQNNDLKIEINILGFSLGRIKALGYYCANPHLFHSCISINSAPKLVNINPESLRISQEDWSKMLSRSMENSLTDIKPLAWENCFYENLSPDKTERKTHKAIQNMNNIYHTLYFGIPFPNLRDHLSPNVDRYLSIVSGSDKIVNKDQWAEILPGKHIHQLIVAGVDHIPTLDPNWADFLPRVFQNMMEFISSCDDHTYKKNVVEEVIEFVSHDIIAELKFNDEFSYDNQKGTYKNAFQKMHLLQICNGITEKFKMEGYCSQRMDICYKIMPQFTKEFREIIQNAFKKTESVELNALELFLKFYYISKVYFPNFPELIEKIESKIKRRNNT